MRQPSRIRDAFESYARSVFPPGTTPEQLREPRRVFFAGAHAALTEFLGAHSEPDSIKVANELVQETMAFAKVVERSKT